MSERFSTRCMTIADWSSIRHFRPVEFARPDLMGYEFMLWLDNVREHAGVAFVVDSSFRTREHNAQVGGAQDSAHLDIPCDAVDISFRTSPVDPHGHYARFMAVGTAIHFDCSRVGVYPDGSIHLDRTEMRRAAPRLWPKVDNPAHA